MILIIKKGEQTYRFDAILKNKQYFLGRIPKFPFDVFQQITNILKEENEILKKKVILPTKKEK